MSDWKQEFADIWNPLGAQVRKNKEAAAAQAATAAGHNPAKIKDAKLAAALSKPTDRTGRK